MIFCNYKVNKMKNLKFNPAEYQITIQYKDFDGEMFYEASVKELPTLFDYGDSYEEAYSLIIDSIRMAKEAFEEDNLEFPLPTKIKESEFTGRLSLRIPKSLHKNLQEAADLNGVSLNQYATYILSRYEAIEATKPMSLFKIILSLYSDTFGDMSTSFSLGSNPNNTASAWGKATSFKVALPFQQS